MKTPNELIFDGSIRHLVWLERYKPSVVRQILKLLDKADADMVATIAARLTKIESRGYDLSEPETKRLKALLDEIRAQRVSAYKLMEDATSIELQEFAVHEADYKKALIEGATAEIAAGLNVQRPSMSQLRAVVTSRPFQGRLLKEWYRDLAEDAADKVSDALKIGIIEGQTTDQIVRRIRGTKVLQYSDGILTASRREVTSVIRTAVAHVANNASEELYAANTEIIQGVEWVSTLDSRTSPTCRARDGAIYKIGKGPRPPAHWNCRSTTVPYLGPEFKGVGLRASATGPVGRAVKYDEWLRNQPRAVQEEVLGKAKSKLFREGNLPLSRFVDESGKEYTLAQLRVLDKTAFTKAFSG